MKKRKKKLFRLEVDFPNYHDPMENWQNFYCPAFWQCCCLIESPRINYYVWVTIVHYYRFKWRRTKFPRKMCVFSKAFKSFSTETLSIRIAVIMNHENVDKNETNSLEFICNLNEIFLQLGNIWLVIPPALTAFLLSLLLLSFLRINLPP